MVVGCVWKSYIRQAVAGELYMMVLIGGVEEGAAVQWKKGTGCRRRGDE
jgi:hypothetical protein